MVAFCKTEITKTKRNKTVQAQKIIETIATDDLTLHIKNKKQKKGNYIHVTLPTSSACHEIIK